MRELRRDRYRLAIRAESADIFAIWELYCDCISLFRAYRRADGRRSVVVYVYSIPPKAPRRPRAPAAARLLLTAHAPDGAGALDVRLTRASLHCCTREPTHVLCLWRLGSTRGVCLCGRCDTAHKTSQASLFVCGARSTSDVANAKGGYYMHMPTCVVHMRAHPLRIHTCAPSSDAPQSPCRMADPHMRASRASSPGRAD